MISSEEKKVYRSELFKHLDGIVTAPTIYTLHKKGVLSKIASEKSISLASLTAQFNANEGYLNVALRILASQDWINYELDNENDIITISTNDKTEIAFGLVERYKDVVHFLNVSEGFHTKRFEDQSFSALHKNFRKYQEGHFSPASEDALKNGIEAQILKHIEGVMVGPITVYLGMDGMFHKYFMEASFSADEFHEDPTNFSKILDFFVHLGWFDKKNEHYRFTNKGLFFARRSSAYGVTVSYIPTFRKLDELIFGNAQILRSSLPNSTELHVDREMNVWGSGGAHSAYFKKIDEVVIELFNRPIDEQPKGILDMGCGNGAFLIHLFEVIEKQTKRGEMLEEYPLFLVGVDYNKAALKVTRANLIKADIWAKVIWGDIGDPAQLERDIQNSYDINLEDLMNVRTFLDHNRPWSDPINIDASYVSASTGAFASAGRRIPNALVEQNLKEHLLKWKPFIKKFGLLLIELHTLSPKTAAAHNGKTAVTAYDATHGFSDQYILELDVFLKVVDAIGLKSVDKYASKFPDNELATVSINYVI